MTDEQIINALKSCGDRIAICDDCPYEGRNHCSLLAKQDIIERFTELKAENAALRERLEKAIELPCKVGDTVYLISQTARCPHGEVVEAKVTDFIGFSDGYRWTAKGGEWFSFNKSDIDAWVFTTREAAEARLAELKGGKE